MNDEELIELIRDAEYAEELYQEAEARRRKSREALVNELLIADLREATVEDEEQGYRVKVVAPERTTIDDEELVKAVGKRLYNKLSSRKADKDKVLAAIRGGEIEPASVAAAVQVKPVTPWPKITRYVPGVE